MLLVPHTGEVKRGRAVRPRLPLIDHLGADSLLLETQATELVFVDLRRREAPPRLCPKHRPEPLFLLRAAACASLANELALVVEAGIGACKALHLAHRLLHLALIYLRQAAQTVVRAVKKGRPGEVIERLVHLLIEEHGVVDRLVEGRDGLGVCVGWTP